MMHDDHTEHQGPSFGGHGMLIVGEETVYLSHLPMFMLPHNFQAILEVAFDGEGDPYERYLHDRRHTGAKLYTLNPMEEFNLTDLTVDPADVDPRNPMLPPPRRSSFNAKIFRNHFERGGMSILENVVVDVRNVVLFRQLDVYAPYAEVPPLLPQLEYFLVGKAQELFLAHVITQPPDFDQILSVKVDGHEFTDEALRHGVLVTVPERANSPSERIKEGERTVAEAQLAGNAFETVEIQVETGTEFYFEEGELRVPHTALGVPHTFEQTEEERSAGF